jgi:uncharacterized tellurite resistance protein B-like protein
MAYAESRQLRELLDDGERLRVLGCLHALAAADGNAGACEFDKILQVAAELGFTGRDVAAFRRRQLRA